MWVILNYLITFVAGVVIVGGSVLGWVFLVCILNGWIHFDDGHYSNFD